MSLENPLQPLLEDVERTTGKEPFSTAVILGSGFSNLVDHFEILAEFPYARYSCFPLGTVAGHNCTLYAARCHGERILLFSGRFHLYQGLTSFEAAAPVRIAAGLGCRRLVLTCAVGGLRNDLDPGDLLWIADHINLQGDTPLRGMGDAGFLDLSRLYANHLFPEALKLAAKHDFELKKGVLAAVPGPNYETPAEVRMLRTLGADVVSMSTVPEAIQAGFYGMELVGLALVANPGAGLTNSLLDHSSVMATVRSAVAVSGCFLPDFLASGSTESVAPSS